MHEYVAIRAELLFTFWAPVATVRAQPIRRCGVAIGRKIRRRKGCATSGTVEHKVIIRKHFFPAQELDSDRDEDNEALTQAHTASREIGGDSYELGEGR
jgi:hypothetical protein